MKLKFTRFLSLVVVMFTMSSFSAYAAGSSYYSKVTAKAVGNGKVYVKYGSAASSQAYAATSSASSGAQSSKEHTYYLYAQAVEGNVFAGWYDNEGCTGTVISLDDDCTVTINANSTSSTNPTAKTYYAKFVSASAPILAYGTAHAYANISAGTYKNESLTATNVTGTITYESSNENVATVAADGTVTLKKNGSCYITAKAGELEAPYILTVIDDLAAGNTQIGNGDFENWSGVTSSNHAPNNWNSFETADGTFSSFVKSQQVAMVEGGRPGSNGLYCVDIYSQTVQGVAAQGNLTLGCINAGAMTAAAAGNHNFSRINNTSMSETISKIPSAIKLWVKFVPAAVNDKYPNARVSATVHDAHNYITYGQSSDDNETNKGYAIAQAEQNFSACDWTELTIPFELTGNTTDGQMYILVNISTNAEPGQGQVVDHLYVDDVELVYTEVYDKYIGVAVNNIYAEPVEAPIEVSYYYNNTIDFNLKNFCMPIGGNTAYVGNISLPGLAMDEEGNFSFDGKIQIAAGNKEGVAVDEWIGPGLGDIPAVLQGTITDDYFYVHIDINVGYPVEVEVGDLASATVSVSSALVSTFCAPFTVAIPAGYQSFVTASTVTGIEGNVLTLTPVENYVIPANTPVIVEIPQSSELSVSGIFVKGTPTAGLLTGVYAETSAPVGSYVLQNLSSGVAFYQVATGQQPTVGANRCYLTLDNNAPGVKALVFPDGTMTSISEIQAADEKAVIYDLSGRRVSKATKGIYITNGKKFLVK